MSVGAAEGARFFPPAASSRRSSFSKPDRLLEPVMHFVRLAGGSTNGAKTSPGNRGEKDKALKGRHMLLRPFRA